MRDEAYASAFATIVMLGVTVFAALQCWPLPDLILSGGVCLACDLATACLALSE